MASNDINCAQEQSVLCVRERRWKPDRPIRSVRFSPQKWRTLVNHKQCHGIHNTGRWFNQDVHKFVPGTPSCNRAFIDIKYVSEHNHFEDQQSPNCLYSHPNGYVCSDWKSPTLHRDLKYAMRQHKANFTSNFTLDSLRNPAFLRIWNRALNGSPHEELLSRYVYGPCIASSIVMLQNLISNAKIGVDEAVVVAGLSLIRDCGTSIPLTQFRLQLLVETISYFKSKMNSPKAKLLLEVLLKNFKKTIKIVRPDIEDRRAATGISLLLSQMKVRFFFMTI